MPKKRKYQRGGSTAANSGKGGGEGASEGDTEKWFTEKWFKKNLRYLVFAAVSIIALLVIILIVTIGGGDGNHSSQPVPKKTMGQLLATCIKNNEGEGESGPDPTDINECISNYLSDTPGIDTYSDLYDSGFFEDLENWIQDESFNLRLEREINLSEDGTEKALGIEQMKDTIKNYRGGDTILCMGDKETVGRPAGCRDKPVRGTDGWDSYGSIVDGQSRGIIRALSQIYKCVNNSNSCGVIFDDPEIMENYFLPDNYII